MFFQPTERGVRLSTILRPPCVHVTAFVVVGFVVHVCRMINTGGGLAKQTYLSSSWQWPINFDTEVLLGTRKCSYEVRDLLSCIFGNLYPHVRACSEVE